MALSLLSPLCFHTLCFLLFILSLFLLKQKQKGLMRGVNLPPSPPRLPIIGNLHQLGKLPHYSLWKLSQKYGPVMLLQLGSIPTIVISSSDMAKEVLKTHDLDCCNRPNSPGPKKLAYNFLDVAFSPYNNGYWRDMRKTFASELLGMKRVQSFWKAREGEVNNLISFLSLASTNAVNLNEKIFALAEGIVTAVAFGKSYGGKQFKKRNFQDVLDEAMDMLSTFSAEDFFPFVGKIIDSLSGLQARLDNSFRELDGYFQMVIDEHLDPTRPRPDHEDFVDVLIRLSREQMGGFCMTKDNIKAILMNTFLGGIDTSAITIIWAMSELIKNPRVLNKVQDEIRSCIGKKPKVEEEDVGKLEYLKMVVKETLRMHPPAPLLIPHETIRHCKIGGSHGFDIYPKTRILVNAWAIGRDPNSWNKPEEFCPERFQHNEIDFKGKNYEMVPFGAGRRICPGLNMGIATVEFTLANLLYCFNWEVPSGMMREDINMEEEGGLTVHKKTPLCLVPIKYNWMDYE